MTRVKIECPMSHDESKNTSTSHTARLSFICIQIMIRSTSKLENQQMMNEAVCNILFTRARNYHQYYKQSKSS